MDIVGSWAAVLIVTALCVLFVLFVRAADRRRRRSFSSLDGIYGPCIRIAEEQMEKQVRERCRNAKLSHMGVPKIHPRHLVLFIKTDTDFERDSLRNDPALIAALRATLAQNGYPADAAPLVKVEFESEETVRREYGGSWQRAMK